ncbi:PaaI family thioesterase [Novosphingobium sp. KCTC 2891]|uniref:PaaI family thioesterase n=1 Tax=Novosphingobium sp. KCTC 2891 TaxID=2989730 RepID=UPI0022217A4B|nr:PaaI family thioesterase [Novosphingobium sp. KCTC 2891]MCW1381491.1 PaaI family thioesterase [Novosphingobium sp. KCTC 2891]
MSLAPETDLADDLGGAAATERLQGIPFARAIGMTATRCGGGTARSTVPFRGAFAIQPGDDRFCEGIIAAVADQAGSVAIWSRLGLAFPHATVSLSLTFLAPARGACLAFDAALLADAGGLGQTSVTVVQPDGREVARGSVDFALGSYPGDAGASTTRPIADPAKVGEQIIEELEAADVYAGLGLEPLGETDHRLPYRVNLAGSRDPLALHGGAIAAAGAASARAALAPPDGWRIIQLSVDYLRSGLPEPADLHARIVSRTRRTALVEVDVRQASGTRLVARMRVRFHSQ